MIHNIAICYQKGSISMVLQQEISTYNDTAVLLSKLLFTTDNTFYAEKRVWETFYDTYFSKNKLNFYKFEEQRMFEETFTKKTGLKLFELRCAVEYIINAYTYVKEIEDNLIPLPTQAPTSEEEKLKLAYLMAPFYEETLGGKIKKTIEVFKNYETYCAAAKTLHKMAEKLGVLPEKILPCTDESQQLLKNVQHQAKSRSCARLFFSVLLSIPTCGVLFLIAFIISLFPNENLNVEALFTLAGIFTPIFIFIPWKLINYFNEKIQKEKELYISQHGYNQVKDTFSKCVKNLNKKKTETIFTAFSYVDTLAKCYSNISNAFDIRYRQEDLPLCEDLLLKGFADTLKEAKEIVHKQRKERSSTSKEAKEIADTLLAIQTALQEKRQAARDRKNFNEALTAIKKSGEAIQETEKKKQQAIEDLKNSLHHY